MPTFLPPTAASSEVVRTLNEKNEAEKTFEARKADVEIASEEIAGAKSAVAAQEATVQLAQNIRLDLETQLQTAQYMASYFALSAEQREAQITEHVMQIQLLEDGLKARQKDISAAQQNRIAAIEARDRAEAKLQSAKADHDKAFEVAKARGILPDLPTANAVDKKGSKSPERRRSKEGGSTRKRSRSRSLSPPHRSSDRRRSRSRERLAQRDRRRPSPIRRRYRSPLRRRTPPRMRSPLGRRGPPPRRRTPPPPSRAAGRPRSRSRGRRSPTPDRKRRRDASPRRRERSPSPGAERAKAKAKTELTEKNDEKHRNSGDKSAVDPAAKAEIDKSQRRRSSEPGVERQSRNKTDAPDRRQEDHKAKAGSIVSQGVESARDEAAEGNAAPTANGKLVDKDLGPGGVPNQESSPAVGNDAEKAELRNVVDAAKHKKEKKEKKEKHKKEKKEKKESRKDKSQKAERKSASPEKVAQDAEDVNVKVAAS